MCSSLPEAHHKVMTIISALVLNLTYLTPNLPAGADKGVGVG